MIFDLEEIEHENSESMTKQFVSADSSWNYNRRQNELRHFAQN